MVNIKKKYNAPNNWDKTQRYIRIEHNKTVRAWFRTGNSEARINLRNSIFVYPKDTASQMVTKIQFFESYIKRVENESLTLPLQYQTRVLPNIAQLAVIYRPTDKTSASGNYTFHIPHYTGNRSPNITSHTKGNHWAKFTCTDGASVMVYCSSKAEAISTATELNRYVDRKYKSPETKPAVGYMAHEPFKTVKVKPVRADYYKFGKKNNPHPSWRYYFR